MTTHTPAPQSAAPPPALRIPALLMHALAQHLVQTFGSQVHTAELQVRHHRRWRTLTLSVASLHARDDQQDLLAPLYRQTRRVCSDGPLGLGMYSAQGTLMVPAASENEYTTFICTDPQAHAWLCAALIQRPGPLRDALDTWLTTSGHAVPDNHWLKFTVFPAATALQA